MSEFGLKSDFLDSGDLHYLVQLLDLLHLSFTLLTYFLLFLNSFSLSLNLLPSSFSPVSPNKESYRFSKESKNAFSIFKIILLAVITFFLFFSS